MKTISKWGYANQVHKISSLNIHYRPNTSDETVIDEVLVRNVYQKKKINFLIEENDYWLDLGANIGTFSLFVLGQGGIVICVEPEPSNVDMISKNLEENFKGEFGKRYDIIIGAVDIREGNKKLFLGKGTYNKWRHSLLEKKGRDYINVSVFPLNVFLEEYPEINCIKMDIEGTEIPLLESFDFGNYPKIRKLVFEYSFDVDKSIPRFLKIIKRLEQWFNIVHYTKVKKEELEYVYYPPCVNVFCIKND